MKSNRLTEIEERDEWLRKQLDGSIADARTLAATTDLAIARALVLDLMQARAALAPGREDSDE